MIAAAAERADPTRLGREQALGLHAIAAARVALGEPSSTIVVDLAPFATPTSERVEDIALAAKATGHGRGSHPIHHSTDSACVMHAGGPAARAVRWTIRGLA